MAPPTSTSAGKRDGQNEEVDGDEIERKDPGRRAQLGLGAVFDDHHVELPGQHDDGEAAESAVITSQVPSDVR